MRPRIDAVDCYDPNQGWLRRCAQCKEFRPHTSYHKHTRDHKGIQRTCKACSKRRIPGHHPKPTPEAYKTRYAKERGQVIKYSRAHYRTVRGRLLTLISAARVRSRKKELQHDLGIDWALSLWEQQKGCCLITGIPFEVDTPLRTSSKDLNPFSPSLDRIDSSLGYTKDNTRLVCVAVNLALNRFGEDVFKQIAEAYLGKLQ